MKEGKDEGLVEELANTTTEIRKWIEEHKDSPSANIRLIHAIPVLISAVINLEKRVSELETVKGLEQKGGD